MIVGLLNSPGGTNSGNCWEGEGTKERVRQVADPSGDGAAEEESGEKK